MPRHEEAEQEEEHEIDREMAQKLFNSKTRGEKAYRFLKDGIAASFDWPFKVAFQALFTSPTGGY